MKFLATLIQAVAVTALVAVPADRRDLEELTRLLAIRNPQTYSSGSGSSSASTGDLGGLLGTLTNIIPDIAGLGDNVIADCLDNIRGQTSKLNDILSSFSGAGDAAPLASAGADVYNEINSSISKIQPLSELPLLQTIGLLPPVFSLQSVVDQSVNNIIAKKSTIDQACIGPAVLSVLTELRDGASNLSQLISSKIFIVLRPIADFLGGNIVRSLENALAAYQGDNSSSGCSGGGSGGSGGDGSSYTTTRAVTRTTAEATINYSTAAAYATGKSY